MTLKINTVNAPMRRCYNFDEVQAALERAVSQRKTPARTRAQQNKVIRELAKLRGAERDAEIWIANNLGTPQEFLASLGARARRLHNLFGNGPIR